MAGVSILGSAEIDIASGREVSQGFESMKHWIHGEYQGEPKPIIRPLMGSVPASTAGTNICYFGVSPPAQKEWHVLSWAIGVVDDHTVPTGPGITTGVNQIPLGATGVATYNNNAFGVFQSISGGTVTAIAVNGVTTGLTSGTFFVPAGGTLTVTYSVAPTFFLTTVSSIPAAAMYGGDPFNPMLGTCRAPGLAIPSYNVPGQKRIIIHSTEYLFFMFYNMPAASLIWANVWVAEYDLRKIEDMKI